MLPTGVLQGQGTHRGRGRPAVSHQCRTPVSQGHVDVHAQPQSLPRVARTVPRTGFGQLGGEEPRLDARHHRRSHMGDPQRGLRRTRRKRLDGQLCHERRLHRRFRQRQRGVLPHPQALHGRSGHPAHREFGPLLSFHDRHGAVADLRLRSVHQSAARPHPQRLHPDHGVQHGRGASGGVSLAHGGKAPWGHHHPRGPALHAHVRGVRPLRPHPSRRRHRVHRRPHQLHPRARLLVQGVRHPLHERRHAHRSGLPLR